MGNGSFSGYTSGILFARSMASTPISEDSISELGMDRQRGFERCKSRVQRIGIRKTDGHFGALRCSEWALDRRAEMCTPFHPGCPHRVWTDDEDLFGVRRDGDGITAWHKPAAVAAFRVSGSPALAVGGPAGGWVCRQADADANGSQRRRMPGVSGGSRTPAGHPRPSGTGGLVKSRAAYGQEWRGRLRTW